MMPDIEVMGINHRAALERSFTYQSPKSNQVPRYEQLRDKAKELALMIEELCPGGREKSVALTNLEQVVMWANKSIAMELD